MTSKKELPNGYRYMTAAQFQRWPQSLGCNKKTAALKLGLSPERIYNYESGWRRDGKPATIPRSIDLACMTLALQLQGWSAYPGPLGLAMERVLEGLQEDDPSPTR